MGLAIWEVDRK